MKWADVQQLHSQAAAEVVSTAEDVPAEKWLVGRAEGKWSPAEIVEHLSLAYAVRRRGQGRRKRPTRARNFGPYDLADRTTGA